MSSKLHVLVFQFYVMVWGLSMSSAIRNTSTQLKVSRNTLVSFVQEYGTYGDLKTNRKLRRSKDFFEKMDPFQMELIRMIVHGEFKRCNENRKKKKKDSADSGVGDVLFPTVKSILKIITDDYSHQLPNMTEKKLWICLHRLGFKFKKHAQTKNVLLLGMYL